MESQLRNSGIDVVGRMPWGTHFCHFYDTKRDLLETLVPYFKAGLNGGEFCFWVVSDVTEQDALNALAHAVPDLDRHLANGNLEYRLSIFPIEVPPLRDRKDDIPILASHFLGAACRRFSRSDLQLTASQLRQLQNYDWPGNVRELQNVIERAVIASRAGSLRLDIPESNVALSSAPMVTARPLSHEDSEVIPDEEMGRRVRDNIIAALRRSGGRIYGPGGAAELLRVPPSTLSARVKKLGLKN